MHVIDYIKLIKLASKRKNSPEDYFKFQEAQANHVVKKIKSIFNLSKGCRVLDFGCGNGGYSSAFSTEFEDVLAVDFHVAPTLFQQPLFNVVHRTADLLTFTDDPRDLLFCASVVEHVAPKQRDQFFNSIRNNLTTNGSLYLSFPPFHGIIGGHACAPFHYLPDNIAFSLCNKIKRYQISSYETMYGDWGLYKTSIAIIKTQLISNGFEIIQIRSRHMPTLISRAINENEYLNWHAEFYCRKI